MIGDRGELIEVAATSVYNFIQYILKWNIFFFSDFSDGLKLKKSFSKFTNSNISQQI